MPHIPRNPPTLYCDGAAVMRQVTEIDGTFPSLRKGDHCVVPLNLARGAFRPLDLFIDFLSTLDLVAFHHHFVVLNDVNKAGQLSFVAEFTNTPADFISKATRVGYSGAFFDKADYRKSPLTDYTGGIVYRMVPSNPLTETQRDAIVARANKYLQQARADRFVTYNIALRNCETIATDIMKPRSSSMDSMNSMNTTDTKDSTNVLDMTEKVAETNVEKTAPAPTTATATTAAPTKNKTTTTTTNTRGDPAPTTATATTAAPTKNKTTTTTTKTRGDSPQINFALWNIFRWSLQCMGIVFLWHDVLSVYIMLCAVPVLLQSLFLFGNKVHQIRLMWLRGTLGSGSSKHLLFKELFRMLLVGFVSTICICAMPFLMKSKAYGIELSWVTATMISLFVYAVSNLAYSVLAQGTMSLIMLSCGRCNARSSNNNSPASMEDMDDRKKKTE